MKKKLPTEWDKIFANNISIKVLISRMYWSCHSAVKNLPALQETQVPHLVWEDPLEKEMTTHSSIGAWEIL